MIYVEEQKALRALHVVCSERERLVHAGTCLDAEFLARGSSKRCSRTLDSCQW